VTLAQAALRSTRRTAGYLTTQNRPVDIRTIKITTTSRRLYSIAQRF
jgi:hypothetical protein